MEDMIMNFLANFVHDLISDTLEPSMPLDDTIMTELEIFYLTAVVFVAIPWLLGPLFMIADQQQQT
jgi:hypothetical protein